MRPCALRHGKRRPPAFVLADAEKDDRILFSVGIVGMDTSRWYANHGHAKVSDISTLATDILALKTALKKALKKKMKGSPMKRRISSTWREDPEPCTQADLLPHHDGGWLARGFTTVGLRTALNCSERPEQSVSHG